MHLFRKFYSRDDIVIRQDPLFLHRSPVSGITDAMHRTRWLCTYDDRWRAVPQTPARARIYRVGIKQWDRMENIRKPIRKCHQPAGRLEMQRDLVKTPLFIHHRVKIRKHARFIGAPANITCLLSICEYCGYLAVALRVVIHPRPSRCASASRWIDTSHLIHYPLHTWFFGPTALSTMEFLPNFESLFCKNYRNFLKSQVFFEIGIFSSFLKLLIDN